MASPLDCDLDCDCFACTISQAIVARGNDVARRYQLLEAMLMFECFLMNVLTAVALKATFAYGFTIGVQAEREARLVLREF